MKTCKGCGRSKPCTDFWHDRSRSDGLCRLCKDCSLAQAGAWREKNRERHLANAARANRRRVYGIEAPVFDAMVAAQRGKCAVCSGSFGPGNPACLDHNHDSGAVRGLLCRYCNIGIGFVERLRPQAQEYLQRYDPEFNRE